MATVEAQQVKWSLALKEDVAVAIATALGFDENKLKDEDTLFDTFYEIQKTTVPETARKTKSQWGYAYSWLQRMVYEARDIQAKREKAAKPAPDLGAKALEKVLTKLDATNELVAQLDKDLVHLQRRVDKQVSVAGISATVAELQKQMGKLGESISSVKSVQQQTDEQANAMDKIRERLGAMAEMRQEYLEGKAVISRQAIRMGELESEVSMQQQEIATQRRMLVDMGHKLNEFLLTQQPEPAPAPASETKAAPALKLVESSPKPAPAADVTSTVTGVLSKAPLKVQQTPMAKALAKAAPVTEPIQPAIPKLAVTIIGMKGNQKKSLNRPEYTEGVDIEYMELGNQITALPEQVKNKTVIVMLGHTHPEAHKVAAKVARVLTVSTKGGVSSVQRILDQLLEEQMIQYRTTAAATK